MVYVQVMQAEAARYRHANRRLELQRDGFHINSRQVSKASSPFLLHDTIAYQCCIHNQIEKQLRSRW